MSARLHLAIIDRAYVGPILDGRKRVESRLGRDRRAPFGVVSPGDRVCFKQRSGPCVALATVVGVECLELAPPAGVRELRDRVQAGVLGSSEYWRGKLGSRYATLIWFAAVEPIDSTPDLSRYIRAGNRSAWHVLPAAAETLVRDADRLADRSADRAGGWAGARRSA
ncbi:MAG: ASCH domain-containing protein [Phycisphaerales bacterium]